MAAPDDLAACRCEHPQAGCAVIHIWGELDACSAPRLEKEVLGCLSPDLSRVVLDMADVAFLDSTGVRLIMQVLHDRQPGTEVVLVSPTARAARRTLDILGVHRVVQIVDRLEAALTGVPSTP